MSKIKSSVEAAKEAVSGIDSIEKVKFKKVTLKESNVPGMKNALEAMNTMEKALNELVDVTKKQAKKIVELAEKKEQDDKNDGSAFTSAVAGGSGGGRSLDHETLKDRLNKKADWQKYGRENLEGAGVYFKQDGSGYVIDGAKVVDNIVNAGVKGAFDIYGENHDQKERRQSWKEKKNEGTSNDKIVPNKPDFDPEP